jgi:hypothetical protein
MKPREQSLTQEQVADLLALRDGELAPARAAELDQDPGARAELAVLRQLKHELRELPGVAPPPGAWAAIQARSRKRPRGLGSLTEHFPLATAATVFLAALVGIMVWDPANLGSSGAPASVTTVTPASAEDARYAALVNRSQQLEAALLYPASTASWSPSQEAMLLRIADLDAELSAAGEDQQLLSLEAREALWRQRVALLESLAQSRRARVQSSVY